MQQTLAVGWFPAPEWLTAGERWPVLLEELPADHDAYLASIQTRLGSVRAGAIGTRLVLVALTVPELDEAAAAEGVDAGDPTLRGLVASRRAGRGEGVVWPPPRNSPCWCGSGRKYKACCATRSVAPVGGGVAEPA